MVDLPITKWIKKKIRRLIAIVEDTDVATHSIASGKYVVWKGDLCKATAPIAVGGALSLSNLSPVSDGGLNELSEQIEIQNVSFSNMATGVSLSNLKGYKIGHLVVLQGYINIPSGGSAASAKIFDVDVLPKSLVEATVNRGGFTTTYAIVINTSGKVYADETALPQGFYPFAITYVTDS